jgi:acetyl esterase
MVYILPQVQAFLGQIAAMSAGLPKMREMPAAFGRQSYVAVAQLADKPAPDVPWRDETIAGMPVRLYAPLGAKAQQCFLFMHGGGWVIGDLASHHMLAAEIAHQLGVMTLAIDYRLAPEHPFPAAHDDCFAVAKAIIDGALGAMTKIIVGGDSAGGNLAAACAQKYREAIAGQLLIYPATDLLALDGSMQEFAHGYMLEKPDMDWFQQQFVPPGVDPKDIRLSPIYGDLQNLPPAVVLTCGLDPLRDQGNAYAAAMRAAGTIVEHHVLEGLPHMSFQLRAAMPAAQAALTQGLADLARIAR